MMSNTQTVVMATHAAALVLLATLAPAAQAMTNYT